MVKERNRRKYNKQWNKEENTIEQNDGREERIKRDKRKDGEEEMKVEKRRGAKKEIKYREKNEETEKRKERDTKR